MRYDAHFLRQTTRDGEMKLAFIKTLTLTAALSVSHLATASLITDHGTSGVANNGTLVGTTSLTTNSKYGSHALHSTGAGTLDGLYIGGDLTDLDQVGDFAAMAWVNVNNLQGGNGILTLGSCCNTRNGYTLNLRSNGVLRFWGGLDANNTNYNAYSSSSISDNQWHHVGVRVTSGGLLELLVDGIVEASINYGLSTSPSQSDFANSTVDSPSPTVGGDGISSKNESDLYIDEVRVIQQLFRRRGMARCHERRWVC